MNRYVTAQVVGIALLVLGAQGAIRLLVDHSNAGLVRWMPGGFTGWLLTDLAAALVGVGLAGWAARSSRS